MMSEHSTPRAAQAGSILCVIIGLGLLLRVAHLTSESFWMDEGFTAFLARTDFRSFVAIVRRNEMNMALYYTLMRVWTRFAITEFWVRFFSVVASAATLPVVYFIGKRLRGRTAGLIAACLMAVHPGHILYAQEARSYSLEVLLVCLAALYLLRFIESGSNLDFAGYLGAFVFATYSHLLAVLAVVAQLAGSATQRKRLRLTRTSSILIVATSVLLLPMLTFVVTRGTGFAAWIPRLSWHAVLDALRLITLPKFSILYVLVWIAAVVPVFRRPHGSDAWAVVFLLSWLVLPIMLLALISIYKPILVPRLVLICVPPVCLLAASGMVAMAGPLRWVAFLLVTAASFTALQSQYRHTEAKEDWRGATAYVCSQAVAGDQVEIVPEYGRFTFDYYRELRGIPADQFSYVAHSGVSLPFSGGDRKWLIVFGASDSNSIATEALSRATRLPGGPFCTAQSAQFNLIEVWLLQRCR